MRYNKFTVIFLTCSLMLALTFSAFSQIDLIEETNEYVIDNTKVFKRLIEDLNCSDYQDNFKKSYWTRLVEFILGSPKESCCYITNNKLFDSMQNDYNRIQKNSLNLQYELSRRVGFNELCDINNLNVRMMTFIDVISKVLNCKDKSFCNSIKNNKVIKMCQRSVFSLKKELFEGGLIQNVETCLKTNLMKPVIKKTSTAKKPRSDIKQNFNQLLFDGLISVKKNIKNNITQDEVYFTIKQIEQLNTDLMNLWTQQILNPHFFKIYGQDKSKPICNTSRLSSKLAEISSFLRLINNCYENKKCNERVLNGFKHDLQEELEQVDKSFIRNKEFEMCMIESIE